MKISQQRNPTLDRNDQALGLCTMSSHQIEAAWEQSGLGQKAGAGPEGIESTELFAAAKQILEGRSAWCTSMAVYAMKEIL